MKPMDSGIYVIESPAGFYLGSSQRLAARWIQHKTQLRAGRHHSRKLQAAWDEHGEALTFRVIELCPISVVLDREQFWMDTMRPNLNIRSDTSPGWRGMRHTADARARISLNNKGKQLPPSAIESMRAKLKGRKIPEEVIAKRVATVTGRKYPAERVARVQASRKRTYDQRVLAGLPGRKHKVRRSDAKLTVEQMEEIRSRYVPGRSRWSSAGVTMKELAAEFGVSYPVAWKAVHGEFKCASV